MLDASEIAHVIILSVLDITCMIINSLYIFIIERKTPKALLSYSILLLNIACVDLLASFCSFINMASLEDNEGRVVLEYLGPCTFVNAQFCHLFMAAHVNLNAQSTLLLLISFAYRLSMLRTQDKRRIVILWDASLLVTLVFTLLNMLAFYVGGSYDVAEFPGDRICSILDLTGGITENSFPRISIFSLIVTYNVGFVTVFFIRRRLFEGIKNVASADRHSHQMIYHSLTAQLMLPLAYLLGTAFWLLDVSGIVRSRMLQRSIFILSSSFALASPLMNMYYIPPYRKYLESLFIVPTRIEPLQKITGHSDSRF